MKRLLLAGTILGAFPAAAMAQMSPCFTDASGNTFCDPASFHVSSGTATGSDPVLLNDSNTFTITEVGNHTINQPIRIVLVEPAGGAPDITSVTGFGAGGSFSLGPQAITAARAFDTTNGLFDGPVVTLSAGQDVGKVLNLPGADASVSYTNIAAEYGLLGLSVPTTFNVEVATIPVAFNSDADFLTVNGSFPIGKIIAPIAVDVEVGNNGKLKVTTFDTAWTNAGFVNKLSVPPVPEPSTWVLVLGGFAFMGWLGGRYNVRRASY